MKINSYLTFNGNCREAMLFYRDCLGGALKFQTIGESPLSTKMPVKMKECILHATLSNEAMLLMGTDMVGGNGLVKGNAVSLSLHCTSEAELKKCYSKLSEGGHADHLPETTFFGSMLGDLTDKFGNHWLLHFDLNEMQDGD